MPKILSKSGDSLADLYDVEGSIAGVENLISKEVNLVHEMGGVILSERLGADIQVITTSANLQNVTFNNTLDLGTLPIRLLGVQVLSTNSARILNVSVHISTPAPVQDIPILTWEAGDAEILIQASIAGSIAAHILLQPNVLPTVPNLLIGTDSLRPTPTISLRGITDGFGAGTVIVRAIVYTATPILGGVSSRGLPLPSW